MVNLDLAVKTGGILSAKKGEDIRVIDISEQSSFADFFVNATALNERQLSALADEVEGQLSKEGILPKNVEGRPNSGWLLMDYGDMIVNVFLPQQREMYQIEKIWSDGKFVEIE
ncbi:MAG: ribosome silencing factor [Clostridiales Family XIII bacterium]|nr:ribosome silencing factor [Clostridiales Family XIII bacterium]